MKFEPRPQNTFREFIQIYWDRCRAACPALVALSGKWNFEDLIPGLSDFDTRLVFGSDLSPDDWAAVSLAIGRVHSQLAHQEPGWARILEHLPGINLTLEEIVSPRSFYPEFLQWTFYHGDSRVIDQIVTHLESVGWSDEDERYHLRRLATFLGPYQRGIDPAINVGLWENKYPLHSRFLHYFTPAVQAGVSLMLRRTIRGKREALRLAQKIFPNPAIPAEALTAIEGHFEMEEYYRDDRLRDLEKSLEHYLNDVGEAVGCSLRTLRWSASEGPETFRMKVGLLSSTPERAFYEVFKFCRLMKGRLLFYASDLPWFETAWLIRNELSRLRRWFYEDCFSHFAQARFGLPLSAEQTLERLDGKLLTCAEAAGVRSFALIASSPSTSGHEKQRAYEVAESFEPLHRSLEKMWREIRTN